MFNNCSNGNNNSDNNNKQDGIDIPSSLRHYYHQDRILYEDILSYGNDDFNMQQQIVDDGDDPMTDQNFLAFLSMLSSSEPTPPPSSSLLLLQGHYPQPVATTSATLVGSSNNKHTDKKKQQGRSVQNNYQKKSTSSSSTKVGQCEHPKHVLYRQEKYTLMSSTTSDEASVMKTIPRRGRPPKGSKSTEFLLSTSPVDNGQNYYPIVELSVRPLPKRLEAVVGKSNIKVCLTCLKRSDMDQEYLQDKAYVGPQQIYKKKDVSSSHNHLKHKS